MAEEVDGKSEVLRGHRGRRDTSRRYGEQTHNTPGQWKAPERRPGVRHPRSLTGPSTAWHPHPSSAPPQPQQLEPPPLDPCLRSSPASPRMRVQAFATAGEPGWREYSLSRAKIMALLHASGVMVVPTVGIEDLERRRRRIY